MSEDNVEHALEQIWEAIQEHVESIPSNLDKTYVIEELIERLIDYSDQFVSDEDFDEIGIEE